MSERKAVAWFADDPNPNNFFFRSPFRSWKFIVNTVVQAVLIIGFAIVMFENWSTWNSLSRIMWGGLLMIQGAIYPYLRVLQSHRKVNELYLTGQITKQTAESPIDVLLSVADNALNDGLFYSSFTVGLLLFLGFVIRLK